MHEMLSKWYREAKIEPEEDWLAKRWQGVEKFIEQASDRELLEQVRLFHSLPVNDDFKKKYLNIFQTEDPDFPMTENKIELSVLAGAVIAAYLEKKPSKAADILALATFCIDCWQLFSPAAAIPDVSSSAINHLINRSLKLRRIRSVPTISPEDKTKLTEQLSNLKKSQEYDANSLKILAENVESIINTAEKAILASEENLELRQEEINTLWWVFKEYSRDLIKPVAELTLPGACLITGKELADLTQITPGPIAVPAFLRKMISCTQSSENQEVSIQDAVNQSPRKWREKLIKEINIEYVKDFCPVLFAVSKSVETDEENGWQSFFNKAFKIDLTEKLPALKLAIQIYREMELVLITDPKVKKIDSKIKVC